MSSIGSSRIVNQLEVDGGAPRPGARESRPARSRRFQLLTDCHVGGGPVCGDAREQLPNWSNGDRTTPVCLVGNHFDACQGSPSEPKRSLEDLVISQVGSYGGTRRRC